MSPAGAGAVGARQAARSLGDPTIRGEHAMTEALKKSFSERFRSKPENAAKAAETATQSKARIRSKHRYLKLHTPQLGKLMEMNDPIAFMLFVILLGNLRHPPRRSVRIADPRVAADCRHDERDAAMGSAAQAGTSGPDLDHGPGATSLADRSGGAVMHDTSKLRFSERFRSKNKPPPAVNPVARVAPSKERFARITESDVETLSSLHPACCLLLSILRIESVRHHGRAFVLPTDALATLRGLSRRNLRRALAQLETRGLISVQRRVPDPPSVKVLK